MAKLTLTFKGRPIQAFHFETGDSVYVGRNDSNGIQIDSLAVAPIHAEILFDSDGATINQSTTDFPVEVNHKKTKRHTLDHGDQILIGKHILYYTEDSVHLETTTKEQTQNEEFDLRELNSEIEQKVQASEAQLQILNGRNIGRVISLRGGLTRLGKHGSGVAVIVRRKDGYFVSVLEGNPSIQLNNQSINNKSVQLSNGDTLDIEKTTMQYFDFKESLETEDN